MINNLKLQKDEIIENAKHNYFTQQKIHNAVIKILEKKTKQGLYEFLNKELQIFLI